MTDAVRHRSGMQRLAGALDSFFYPPAPASRLATLRVLVGGYALGLLIIRFPGFASVARFEAAEFVPVGPVTLISAPLPAAAVYLILALAVVAGAAFVYGFRYRISGPAFALLFLWVTSYRSSWGMKFHTENLVAFHLLLLALAPAAERSEAPHGRYGWAIRAMCIVTVTTYVIAGLAKLRLAGADWLSGEALRVHVAYDNLRKIELGSVHSPLGAALVQKEGFFRALGVTTLLLELGAPLALFGRRIARGWVGAAFGFHLGVMLLMAIVFPYPLTGVAYASFFEVERLTKSRAYQSLSARFKRRAATAPQH